MQKCKWMLSLGITLGALALYGGPVLSLTGTSINELRCNARGKFHKLHDGGNPGKCFHLENRKIRELIYHSANMLNIPDIAAQVKITCDVKGKARLGLGFLTYTAGRGILYPPGTLKFYNVDTKGKWQTLELIYTPQAGSLYTRKAARINPQLRLLRNSEILIDNLKVEFLEQNKIVLED